jgi:hypothetical protein
MIRIYNARCVDLTKIPSYSNVLVRLTLLKIEGIACLCLYLYDGSPDRCLIRDKRFYNAAYHMTGFHISYYFCITNERFRFTPISNKWTHMLFGGQE